MKNKPYRKAVTSIIVDDQNKFLIVQLHEYSTAEWKFAGGGVNGDETYEEALYREVEEETGLSKDSYTVIGESSHMQKYDFPESMQTDRAQKYRGQERKQFVLKYVGNKDALNFQDDEIRDHTWVSYDELPTYLIFPGQIDNARKVIEEFNLIS